MKHERQVKIMAASQVWREGGSFREACAILGVNQRRFYDICTQNRDLFPSRYVDMDDGIIAAASEMWMLGVTKEKIGKALSVSKRRIAALADENVNGMFPPRYRLKDGFTFTDPRAQTATDNVMSTPPRDGCMRWVTASGALVTLPKISFIECPRAMQSV